MEEAEADKHGIGIEGVFEFDVSHRAILQLSYNRNATSEER